MNEDSSLILSHRSKKSVVETAAKMIFTICGFFAILAVASITIYTVSYTHLSTACIRFARMKGF